MLLKADAAQLEWRVKAYLSQDSVAIEEIQKKYDIHTANAKEFGLPSRLIAKIFVYRMIFADAFGDRRFNGPAYAYANDPDFRTASTSVKFWEGVIERFFTKYAGMYSHSLSLIRQAIETGTNVSPSGRIYTFEQVARRGEMVWPTSDILNYIVQGFGADLVLLARRNIWQELKKHPEFTTRALLINTVHDSIEMDVDNDPTIVYNVCMMLTSAFQAIPQAAKKCYEIDLNVPQDAETKFGWNLHEDSMIKFNPSTFENDWNQLCKSRS